MKKNDPVSGIVLTLRRIVTVLIASAGIACMPHQYYDDGHSDYHRWNNQESGFYLRWESDGHRDHREFNQRNADEQREYWGWRHTQ